MSLNTRKDGHDSIRCLNFSVILVLCYLIWYMIIHFNFFLVLDMVFGI